MIELAKKRNGECLWTGVYQCSHKAIMEVLPDGHEWEAKPNNIQQGKWCPICARRKK